MQILEKHSSVHNTQRCSLWARHDLMDCQSLDPKSNLSGGYFIIPILYPKKLRLSGMCTESHSGGCWWGVRIQTRASDWFLDIIKGWELGCVLNIMEGEGKKKKTKQNHQPLWSGLGKNGDVSLLA